MGVERVGFLGLGQMGAAVAANLLRAGFSVSVYDVDPERVELMSVQGTRALGA